MKQVLKRTMTSLAVVTALATAPVVQATNGYFKIGYGSKNRGMAGAGAAFGNDSLASAINPAVLSNVGSRMDAGIEFFNPQREGTVDATALIGPGGPGAKSNSNSGATVFAIPNFGYSRDLGNNIAAGVAVIANGGMNTRYNRNIFDEALAPAAGAPVGFFPNTFTLGVNLSQVLIEPTVAYKFTPNHSVGVSLVAGYQRFRAYGLGDFAAFGFSSEPTKLTNNGDDDAWGFGGKVGYTGRFMNKLSIGASYQSKIYMDEFGKYRGLFAEQGDFDIPATYTAGLAFDITPKWTVAFDVQVIEYGDVKAIANDGPTAAEFAGAFSGSISRPLGTNSGFGFGWDDMTIYKLGVEYAYNNAWTFRAGFNYGESPIDDDQNFFNILAPAVVEQHITAGFTYSSNPKNELTVTYMHAMRNDQSYTYVVGGPVSYDADIAMQQNAIEASYSWKF